MKKMTFMVAIRDYFGMKPEQKLGEFMMEIKALSPAVREWFKTNLATVGYEVIESQ